MDDHFPGLSMDGSSHQTHQTPVSKMRTEHDLLGDMDIPDEMYFGIQTMRAVENYQISGVRLSHFPNFVNALALCKKACAQANSELGHVAEDKAAAICSACDDLLDVDKPALHEFFVVDMIQGGAGTSTNMNANEVIANLALEKLGFKKGE